MSYNGYAQEGTSETDRASKTRPGEYQGWANYETWAVGLWLSNERAYYEDVLAMASDIWRDGEEVDQGRLAEQLRDYVEENVEDVWRALESASMATDLLRAALSEVDWYELAESWLQTAKEAAEYEEAK